MANCKVERCDNKSYCTGLCKKHYNKQYFANYRKTKRGSCRIDLAKGKFNKSEHGKLSKSVSNKKYNGSEKGKKIYIEANKRQKKKWPEKFKARYAAKNKIKRQQCEKDNCVELGERHHDDYSMPLNVRFLCRTHHDEYHRKEA